MVQISTKNKIPILTFLVLENDLQIQNEGWHPPTPFPIYYEWSIYHSFMLLTKNADESFISHIGWSTTRSWSRSVHPYKTREKPQKSVSLYRRFTVNILSRTDFAVHSRISSFTATFVMVTIISTLRSILARVVCACDAGCNTITSLLPFFTWLWHNYLTTPVHYIIVILWYNQLHALQVYMYHTW